MLPIIPIKFMIHKNSILDLTKNNSKSFLSLIEINKWLIDYKELYKISITNSKCHPLKFISCNSNERDENCLFLNIYNSLEKHLEELKASTIREELIKNEIEKYEICKSNDFELKKWLKSNLENGLQIYLEFDFNNKNKIIEEFIFFTGKHKNHKPKYLRIMVNNENTFENLHLFSKIFIELFFEQKLLLNEYEKWKKEVGYEED